MDYFLQSFGSLLDPFRYLFDPSKRIFGAYLVCALLIAVAVYYARERDDAQSSLWRYLFPKRVWLHRSALLDYKLVFVVALVKATLIAPLMIPRYTVAALVSTCAVMTFGEAPTWDVSSTTVALGFTLVLFVADDFTRFVFHAAMHRIEALWQLHQVHHSAEVLTPVTLYRIHPLESLIVGVRDALTFGFVTGLFFYVFREQLTAWDVLGVQLFSFVFNLMGANLRHSHVQLRYPPWLERIFISPAQHQLHHSRAHAHHDTNYGVFLAVWDRLLGTLLISSSNDTVSFGLAPDTQNHSQSLWSILWHPVVAATKKLRFKAHAND